MKSYASFLLILLTLFITATSLVQAEEISYYRPLGDGCQIDGVAKPIAIYSPSCTTICSGDGLEVVEQCTVIHGWCSDNTANTCTPCDFVEEEITRTIKTCGVETPDVYTSQFDDTITKVTLTYTCEEKEVSAMCVASNREVITETTNELNDESKIWAIDYDGDLDYDPSVIHEGFYPPAYAQDCLTIHDNPDIYCNPTYWVNTELSNPDPDDNNPFLSSQTQYCVDENGYTKLCGPSNVGDVVPDYTVINTPYACEDGNPMTLYWQEGNNGRWKEVLRACSMPSGSGWKTWNVDNGGYIDTGNLPNFPDESYDCGSSTDDTFPENCYCSNDDVGKTLVFGDNSFTCIDLEGSSTILGSTDFTLTREIQSSVWRKGASFSGLLGDVNCPENTCGISGLMPGSDKDYCVSPGTLATTSGQKGRGDLICELSGDGAKWVSRLNKIGGLFAKMGESHGEDYVLYCDYFDNIQHHYPGENDDDDTNDNYKLILNNLATGANEEAQGCILILQDSYSTASKPEKYSQKVAFALPLASEPDSFLGNDFTYGSGDQIVEKEGMYILTDQNILFVLQSNQEGTAVDPTLLSLFNQVKNPNSFTINFFRFLRSPIQTIAGILGLGPDEANLPQMFDKVFIGKSGSFYWNSVSTQDNMYMKIANPDDNLKIKLSALCTSGNCETNNNVWGISLSSNNWEMWSRELRVQNGPAGTADFFSPQCETDADCTSPPNGHKSPGTCTALNFCEYEEDIGAADGYCPKGATIDNPDIDCKDTVPGDFDEPSPEDNVPLLGGFTRSCLGQVILDGPGSYPPTIPITNLQVSLPSNNEGTGQPVLCINSPVEIIQQPGAQCPVTHGQIITLSSYRFSHVRIPGGAQLDDSEITLCGRTASAPLTTDYKVQCTRRTTCEDNENAIFAMSSEKNAHVSEAGSAPDGYTNLCCSYLPLSE